LATEDIAEYFKSINKLEDDSEKLIKKEIKKAKHDAKSGEVHIDPEVSKEEMTEDGNPLSNCFVHDSHGVSKEIKHRLYSLMKELIIFEMENKHYPMYKKINQWIHGEIKKQVDDLDKDKEEILYFMDASQIQNEDVDAKLLKDHSNKLESMLKEDYPNTPTCLVQYAKEQLKNAIIKEVYSGPNAEEKKVDLGKDEDYEDYGDIQDEWYSMSIILQESIHSEQNSFWDKSITGTSAAMIDNMLELFLLAQKLRTKKEYYELGRVYTLMTDWIHQCCDWRDVSEKHYQDLFDRQQSTLEIYDNDDPKKMLFPQEIIDTSDNFRSYTFKFIVIHMCMFLTKNVNSSGKFSHTFYNASHTRFLRSFISAFYSPLTSIKIVRAIEKSMGDFNKKSLNFEYQDPITASGNTVYKSEDYSNGLDFIKFANKISDNDDDFEEYLENTEPIEKFGEKDEGHNHKKDNYKLKSKIIVAFMKAFTKSKDNEIIKADFDLLSNNCPTNKHVLISIGGLQNDRQKLTEKWEQYLKNNESTTVYAYRWKTRGMNIQISDFVPGLASIFSIGKLFSKAYLAYKAVKVPLDYRKKFVDCWDMSKLYGQFLAHALILQFPFVNQSVSLFGFELGAQVLFS